MKKETGGPAFPNDYEIHEARTGMTLRDYFAGQALALMSGSGSNAQLANECYEIADAMLRERKR